MLIRGLQHFGEAIIGIDNVPFRIGQIGVRLTARFVRVGDDGRIGPVGHRHVAGQFDIADGRGQADSRQQDEYDAPFDELAEKPDHAASFRKTKPETIARPPRPRCGRLAMILKSNGKSWTP